MQVREFMLRSMMALHQRSGGDRYVDEDDEAEWPYNFIVVSGKRLYVGSTPRLDSLPNY